MNWASEIEAWTAKQVAAGKIAIAGRNDGYAAAPGSGPAAETCKTCKHLERISRAKIYRKCGLMRALWTCGPRTDVKASSPACSRWERANANP
jgi:hypothetical protein